MRKIYLTPLFLFICCFSFSQTWKELNDSIVHYYRIGEYEKGIGLGQKALVVAKKEFDNNHPAYAVSLNNLAGLYSQLGLYEKAEPLYIESMEFRKKTLSPNTESYAMGLNNMATIYQRFGQYEKAEALYIEAKEIREKVLGDNHPNYAESLNNLAALYSEMGRYEKASPLLREATELRKKILGEAHPDYGKSLANVAGILIEQNEYKVAEALYKKAISIFRTALGEKHPDYAAGLKSLAGLYLLMGHFQKAESLYMDALQIEKESLGENHPDYAQSLQYFAALYMQMGSPEKAAPLLLQNSSVVLKNMSGNFIALSAFEKQNYLSNTISLLETNNSFLYVFKKVSDLIVQNNFNQQLIFKSLVLESSKNIFNSIQKSSDTVIQNILKNWKAGKQVLSRQYSLPISNRRTDLKNIEENTETLEKELNRKSSAFRSQQNSLLISWQDVQKNLQQDEVAIEFVSFKLYNKKWTDSTIYAAYILQKNNAVPVFVPLCEEKQLQQLFDSAGSTATSMVTNFYRGLEVKSKNAAGSLGRALYNLIWQPLEPYLQGVKKISYSPAGKLYSIAFHALPVDSATVLMDKYELQQYTSTRQVVVREQEKQTDRPKDITLFGDASFSLDSLQLVKGKTQTENSSSNIYLPQNRGTGGDTWTNLPGTAQEVKTIQQLFAQHKISTHLFVQTTASEENLKALSGKSPQILHIATHGFFLPEPDKKRNENDFSNGNTYTFADDPLLRSGLILSGGNYAWSGKTPIEGVEDGIATAYEISQLDLSNTELVVLSACETALGDVKGSEGVFGLQRAFKMAGVKKMIVSLWQVPDKETAELMTAFYTYWMKGKTINKSFAQAQADMRRKYSAFYWAAFVLVE